MQLPGQQCREGNLVHLQAVEHRLAGQPAVLRVRAVRSLLDVEQVVECPVGGRLVAHRDQRGGDLVEVAGPHRVVDGQ
jgi:hypothetical protein